MKVSNNLNSSVNQNFGMALKIKPQAKNFLEKSPMSVIIVWRKLVKKLLIINILIL